MTEITRYKLEAAFSELKNFDVLAKEGDFMEVVMWNNGEGFDVNLNQFGEQHFELTWGQFEALKELVKELDG